jgi:hypothetical protein
MEAQLQRPANDPLRARNIRLINDGHIFGNGLSKQSDRPVGLYFDTKITPDGSGKGSTTPPVRRRRRLGDPVGLQPRPTLAQRADRLDPQPTHSSLALLTGECQ